MRLGLGDILIVYGVTTCVFFLIDLLWLGLAAKGFYARHLGSLLRDQVNWTAALILYAIYIGGIQVFVLIPALQNESGILHAAILGGLLGLFAYSTFDLTSLALLRNWSVTIAVVDIIWGTLLTAGTSAVTLWIVRALIRPTWNS